MLEQLILKSVYSSSRDDLVGDFYNPVLSAATKYDRITGYFSPKVFALAARGFAQLLQNGGKIRVITSVQVDQATIESLQQHQTEVQAVDEQLLPSLSLGELQNQLERDYYDLFVYLLRSGALDLRICATLNSNGILHQKIGIVHDDKGNSLSFSGSNNETVYGWSKNIEQFKVFTSWNESARDYLADDIVTFEALWTGRDAATVTMSIEEAFAQDIFKMCEPDVDITSKVRRIEIAERQQDKENDAVDNKTVIDGITLRDYQREAIESWVANKRCGIFEMATGTGKTLTGLAAVRDLYTAEQRLFCVIAVPLRHLIDQWMEDIELVFPEARIVKVGGDYPSWRDDLPRQVRNFHKKRTNLVMVISTYASMSSPDFAAMLSAYKDEYCILADEVHNAGTPRTLAAIYLFTRRLGLSATPRNKWTDIDADELIASFSGITYSYSLEEAIRNGVLVNYDYIPLPLWLNTEEVERYSELSIRISRAMAANDEGRPSDAMTSLLNQRAAITKNAEEKQDVLHTLMQDLRQHDAYKQMLVYCDNQSQIADVQVVLRELNVTSSKVTFKESNAERQRIMADFAGGFVDALVARKCLDEGVNIPSTRIAVLVASNTDSREYIQRLGRVLRTYPGKIKSTIYDFVVLPPPDSPHGKYRNLLRNELERVAFFRDNALTKGNVQTFIDTIAKQYTIGEEDLSNDEN